MLDIVSPPKETPDRINSDENSGRRVGRRLFGVEFSTRQEQVMFLEKAQSVSEQVMMEASEIFHLPYFHLGNLNGKKQQNIYKTGEMVYI